MSVILTESTLLDNKDKIEFTISTGDFHQIGKVSYINVFYGEHNTGDYAGTTDEGEHYMIAMGAYFPLNKMDEAKAYYDLLVTYYTAKEKTSWSDFCEQRKKHGYSMEEVKKMHNEYFGIKQ